MKKIFVVMIFASMMVSACTVGIGTGIGIGSGFSIGGGVSHNLGGKKEKVKNQDKEIEQSNQNTSKESSPKE